MRVYPPPSDPSPYMHIDALDPKPLLFDPSGSLGGTGVAMFLFTMPFSRPSVLLPRCFICIPLSSALASAIQKVIPSPRQPFSSRARLPTELHLGFPSFPLGRVGCTIEGGGIETHTVQGSRHRFSCMGVFCLCCLFVSVGSSPLLPLKS